MIVIIDYGMGNLGSIVNMLKKIGAKNVKVSNDAAQIEAADRLILPGVGAFDTGMKRLKELNLIPLLNRQVLDVRKPTLGVCLGMQLLMQGSEEGSEPGLGWIDGETIRFRIDSQATRLKIPHMGWNQARIVQPGSIFKNMPPDSRFYFVHSYHVVCKHPEDVLTLTEYGYEFASAVQHDNIMGTQFHPEKSHKFGMAVLRNFVEAA